MEHLLLKAATTATTDQGRFTAVISTGSVDREKDIVEPEAMVKSLQKWAALGKLVPLAWNHTEEIVGHIDPGSAKNVNGEVVADGFVDQATPRGEETWRLVKSGTLSFSFGFLVPDGGATKLAGGRYRIKELDVYEISAIPIAPANNDTRVLQFKGVQEVVDNLADEQTDLVKELQEVKGRLEKAEKALEDLMKDADETDKQPVAGSVDPLRERAQKTALEIRSGGLSVKPPLIKQVVEEPRPVPEMDPAELRKHSRDLMLQVLSGVENE
jgi:HK97 family phage prohead protease